MYPQQPQYPTSAAMPQYPPQQYAAPASQQYPQQWQAAPAPSQPTATGTLDTFFNQPSAGGGKALTFKTPGTTYIGIVTRPVTNGDVQQQTDTQGRPQFFKDGRPKFVMKVPLQMQPSPEYPDGLCTWYVKGQARDELVRAMSEAGAPEGPPEAGAVIQVTYTGDRPSGPGMNPTKLSHVVYQRPNNGQPVAPPVSAPPAAPAPPPAPVPQQYQAPAPQPVAQMPAPAPVAAAPAAAGPPQLSPEQQALLAKLTGGQTAA